MKAAIYANRGIPGGVQVAEIEKPTPKDDEVLLRVCAASVNPLDYHLRKFAPYLVRIPGRDVAGRVEAVGRSVTQFKAGDEVFGTCRGACAEYACVSESRLIAKPSHLSFAQASAVPIAAFTA